MTYNNPNQQEFLSKQAAVHVRLFFINLEKNAAVTFTEFERDLIIRKSLSNLKNHLETHRIRQKSVDAYKLYSFLLYASHEVKGLSESDTKISIREIIDLLAHTIYIETNARIDLSKEEIKYLFSMTHSEMSSMQHVGIGANGLGATFQYMVKSFNKTDKFKAEKARI